MIGCKGYGGGEIEMTNGIANTLQHNPTRVAGFMLGLNSVANNALKAAARLWFLVAALGQWIFVVYVTAYYGPLIVQGGLEGLSETHLPNGYITGDTVGNLAMAAHLLLAVIIIGGGPLQLIPQIRARFPTFHRWLGRTYMLTAVTTSIAGLYLIWTRPLFGSLLSNLGTSLDGVLIIVFAAIALRFAIARNIRSHRPWALRLFMVASGVWFYRVGFSLWLFLTGGAGIDFETFTGPFLDVWGFGQYLLPLAVLELYLRVRDGANAHGRLAMAIGLFGLTILMGIGIYAAAINMWLPKL
jgi:uncharacterized membrane protein